MRLRKTAGRLVMLVLVAFPAFGQVYDRLAFASTRDSPQGTPAASLNWEIYSINTDGSDPVNLTNRQSKEIDPAWSPDGTKIAFASDRTGTFQIFVMDPDGTNQEQLTSGPGHHVWPAWSPDGMQLAYSANEQGGDFDIYVIDADGSDAVNLTESPGPDYAPSWSPDGAQIVFESNRDRPESYASPLQVPGETYVWMAPADIFIMSSLGGLATNLTRGYEGRLIQDPAWSPRGGRIAYAFEDGPSRSPTDGINLIDSGGGGRTRLVFMSPPVVNIRSPSWSPDGALLAVAGDVFASGSQDTEIVVVSPQGGSVIQVTRSLGVDIHPTWSPLSAAKSAVEETTWGSVKALFGIARESH